MSDFQEFVTAITKGDFENVERKFRKEYITMTDKDGLTALHHSCWYDDITIVNYLLDKGWDIESETMKGKYRSVDIAAMNGLTSILNILINRGCLLKERTKYGETPIEVAIRYNRCESAEMIWDALKDPIPSLTRYTRLEYLGRGSFGKVFKCFDPGKELTFAMKEVVIDPDESVVVCIRDIENEVYIHAQLKSHPRIVRYFGTSRSREELRIFMEYMPGGTIKDQLDKCGSLPLNIIARYTKQILEGLDFLHQKNIIHRDVKAANILRDTNDNIKLCDFGISRRMETISSLGQSGGRVSSIVNAAKVKKNKMTKSFAGSIYWMAPEVILGEEYGTWVDVWSLGATVVEMLTGNPPYHNMQREAALFKIGTTRSVKYTSPKDVPSSLHSFLKKTFVANARKRETVKMLLKSDFIKENS